MYNSDVSSAQGMSVQLSVNSSPFHSDQLDDKSGLALEHW